jgi:hypothetical protein
VAGCVALFLLPLTLVVDSHCHPSKLPLFHPRLQQETKMSSHDNDELIDYEDENDVVPNGATLAASGGATTDDDKDKKNFSGIHSTGFRSVYLPLHIIIADN